MPFTALVDFHSDDTKSHYIAGMSYTARTLELQVLVTRWVKEGKVRWGGPVIPAIEGRG